MSQTPRRRRPRYTRKQIMIHRLIVLAAAVLLLVLMFLGIRWALAKLNIIDSPSVFESEIAPKEEENNKEQDTPKQSENTKPAKEKTEKEPQEEYQGIDLDSVTQTSSGGLQREAQEPYYEPELPLLTGPDNPISKDFQVDVVEIGGGYKFDSHAAQALKDMLAAAAAENISLYPISAYRSYESQTRLYTNKVQEYKNYGHDAETAAIYAAKWVARPGTSEHSIGLAVDLNSLEESFENTAAFSWLQKHCAEYGFILRYPKDKVEVTKISYEPWHYRYVGSNHAKIIMEKGICLEEYLQEYGKRS